jgi:putative transposase
MAMRLTEEQPDWLAERVPDAPVSPKGGRPAMDKRKALRGIFWVLDNGAKWKDLPRQFGAKSSVHNYFLTWTRAGVFEASRKDSKR